MFKYYIVISDTLVGPFLDVFFLLLAVISSKLHEKRIMEVWVYIEEYVWRSSLFLNASHSFYVIFCYFLRLLPPPSQVTYKLNGPYKDTYYCYTEVVDGGAGGWRRPPPQETSNVKKNHFFEFWILNFSFFMDIFFAAHILCIFSFYPNNTLWT